MTGGLHTSGRPLAILTALGSRGDINPMLAIAVALREAGVEVLVILPETYQGLADALGLPSEIAITSEDFERQLRDPDLWHPIWGPKILLSKWVPESLPRLYAILERHFRPGKTIFVAHPLDFASRVFRDAHPSVRLASVHLAPLTIRNFADPAHLTTGWLNVRRPAALVRAFYWAADTLLVRQWLEKPLNRFRRSLGLANVAHPLKDWWLSPDLVLGMFPPWFAPAGFSSRVHCCGFPLFDGPESSDAVAAERLLDRCQKPPVVFTAGSAHTTASSFFAAAVETIRRQNLSGILLSSRREQLPEVLPDGAQWVRYVSLGNLLPHCRAIVHHGGIGTTSQALAAGTPQLICPMAFDQFDNAARVIQLGCGRSLPMKRVTGRALGEALARLLGDTALWESALARRRDVASGPVVMQRVVREIQSLLQTIPAKSGVSANRSYG